LDRVFAHPYWRNREADENLKGAVENLKDMITGQATVLAISSIAGGYDEAAITCAATRTDDIGFPHRPNMRPKSGPFPPVRLQTTGDTATLIGSPRGIRNFAHTPEF
jgi:hypothetical protein